MKNRYYSTTVKTAAIIFQQLMAVLLVVFLFLIGSLFNRSMLEFQDIGRGGFEESAYFAQEFKSTTAEVQRLINLRKKFETYGEYDPEKGIAVSEGIIYRLGDLERWAEKGCSYQAAESLSLVEESYQALEGGEYIERYLNGELSSQEAVSISNSIESLLATLPDEINHYKRLINKYAQSKTNVLYYYEDIEGNIFMNLKFGEESELTQSERFVFEEVWEGENIHSQIESSGKYICYDDRDIRFDTNVNGLEEYFYQDVTYITGNMESNAVFMMAVNTKFPHQDSFYQAKQSYNRLHPWIKNSVILSFLSFAGWIAALVYLSTVTGRSAHEDEVHLNGFDEVKTEIMIFAVFLYISGGTWVISQMGNRKWEMAGMMVMAGVLAFVGNAFFLFFYLSLIRRMRAGTLWSNSILYMVLKVARGVYENWKMTGKVALIYAVQAGIVLVFAAWGYYYSQPLFLVILAILMGIVGIFVLKEQLQKQKVIEGIEQIKAGNLEYKIETKELTGENKILSEGINSLGDGLEKAVDQSMKNERMKADLITNVSHDIKTPLTSIINYANLLENENIEDEKIQSYIHILKEKSGRLKQLTEDLVEASKISSGNITLEMVKINLVELVCQTGGEFNERFEERELTVYTKLPKEAVVIMADGRRIWRVLENLYNNVAKYALAGTRVYVEVEKQEEIAVFSIKNISTKPLNIPAEELTERFIRGDVSRSTEGSGLGLSIAENLTTLMGGTFEIVLDGDMFKVLITFPLAF